MEIFCCSLWNSVTRQARAATGIVVTENKRLASPTAVTTTSRSVWPASKCISQGCSKWVHAGGMHFCRRIRERPGPTTSLSLQWWKMPKFVVCQFVFPLEGCSHQQFNGQHYQMDGAVMNPSVTLETSSPESTLKQCVQTRLLLLWLVTLKNQPACMCCSYDVEEGCKQTTIIKTSHIDNENNLQFGDKIGDTPNPITFAGYTNVSAVPFKCL